jgi:hypothetical protein
VTDDGRNRAEDGGQRLLNGEFGIRDAQRKNNEELHIKKIYPMFRCSGKAHSNGLDLTSHGGLNE